MADAPIAAHVRHVVVESLHARDDYNTAPSRPLLDHLHGLETWTNIAFVAGGVLTAGGVALMILPLGSESSAPAGQATVGVRVAPGGAFVEGAF